MHSIARQKPRLSTFKASHAVCEERGLLCLAGTSYRCLRVVLVRRRSVFNRCVDSQSSSSVNGSEAAHAEEAAAEADIDEERCNRDILMASYCQQTFV